MREPCMVCVLKHLGQAHVLMDEAENGYPLYKWLAVGHLAEAESECEDNHLKVVIRTQRRAYMVSEGEVDILKLIEEAENRYSK